jgi:hypothetical protein
VTPCRPYDLYCELAEEGAAMGLLALMTGMSEEYYCASWLIDLEFTLWEIQAGTRFGFRVVTERQATLLRLLSEECDGWWRYDAEEGPVFIRRADWLKLVEARKDAGSK